MPVCVGTPFSEGACVHNVNTPRGVTKERRGRKPRCFAFLSNRRSVLTSNY